MIKTLRTKTFLASFFVLFWISSCAYGQSLIGIDVSNYQGTIDWSKVRGDHVFFAWIKATEGASGAGSTDSYFGANVTGAKAQSIYFGAYHFARPEDGNTADAEAAHFLASARSYIGPGYLPPALDIDQPVFNAVPIATLVPWIREWLSYVKLQTGVTPVLYITKSIAETPEMAVFNSYPLWITDWIFNPSSVPVTGNWSNWNVNQYAGGPTDNVKIAGIGSVVDMDVFNGGIAQFDTFIGLSANTPLPDLTITAGTPAAAPASVTAGSSIMASCSEDNSGTAVAGANDVTVWLSSDAKLTASDTYLGKIAFPAVAAGSNSLINSASVQIPPGTLPGQYYLYFWADGDRVVPESDETNNFASVIITVTAGNQQAQSVTLSASSQCNGASGQVTLNWTPATNAQSYDLYRNGVIYSSGLTVNQFPNTVITTGQTYSYYVVAHTSSGNVTSNTVSETAPTCGTGTIPGALALSATSTCTGASPSIKLSWTNSNNADSYTLYRNNTLYLGAIAGISYTDNSVSDGQSYTYYVVAINSSGTTSSNSITQAAQNCAVNPLPGMPDLTLTPSCNNGVSQIALSWTAATNATGYEIYRNNAFYANVNTATSYTDLQVIPGLTYTYQIKAGNPSGVTTSAYQSANASNCSGQPLPATPSLVVRPGCVNYVSQVTLSWGPDPNTVSYDIYRNYLFYANVTGTSYIDNAVTPDSTYVYYTQANNSIGSSASSVWAARMLDCKPNYPSAPRLTVSGGCNGTSGVAQLNWTTSNNAAIYDVYRDGVLIYTALIDQRSYTDESSTTGESHTYYVSGENGFGAAYSDTLSVAVPSCVPPPTITSAMPLAAPAGATITINGTNFDNSSTVSFGGVPAQSVMLVSSTELQAVVGNGITGNIVVTNLGGSAAYAGFSYIFSLPANNFTVSSTGATCRGVANGSITISASQVLGYTMSLTGPGINQTGTFGSQDTINNLTAGAYQLCIGVSGEAYQQCFTVNINQPPDLSVLNTVNDQDKTVTLTMAGGTIYHILLNGNSYTTESSSIRLPLNSGPNQLLVTTDKVCQGNYQTVIELLDQIVPFPNPFDQTVHINVGNAAVGSALFEVHDTRAGHVVFSKSFGNIAGVVTLTLPDLPIGVYALHVKLDHIEKIYKIIRR